MLRICRPIEQRWHSKPDGRRANASNSLGDPCLYHIMYLVIVLTPANIDLDLGVGTDYQYFGILLLCCYVHSSLTLLLHWLHHLSLEIHRLMDYSYRMKVFLVRTNLI